MTDFIHEPPHEGAPAPRQEPPVSGKEREKKVSHYILILFLVTFCLLLWSFLMSARSGKTVQSVPVSETVEQP